MKLCPKCHTENVQDANFCMRCKYQFAEAQPQVRLCPAGKHTMDPDWTSCPYCKAAQSDPLATTPSQDAAAHNEAANGGVKRKKTVVEDPQAQQPIELAETIIDEESTPLAEPKRKTVFGSANSEPAAGAAHTAAEAIPALRAGRRIVAMLVTYTWRPEGQVFPVYEGRNYLGQDLDCEICLPSDDKLSRIHTAIFYRGAGFEISDEKSLNGTYVNGQPVPLAGQPLQNYSELRTGATVWRFITVAPETSG